MGLKLRNPLVPSASPLSRDIDTIKRMEDAGAGAVVLYSLFEEEMAMEQRDLDQTLNAGAYANDEAQSFFPQAFDFLMGPEQYLQQIQKAKAAVDIPIIASLNGSTAGGWTSIARKMQEAGADALELNIYAVSTDMNQSSAEIEECYLSIFNAVKKSVNIPVAVKLSPYFTNMANMARRFDEADANALVLFNRFYQPDIDLEDLAVKPGVLLSTPMARRLPLRWIAILHGRIKADLAATSGIHSAEDALKMIMAGASVTMLCSALLRHGVDRLRSIEADMLAWMEENEYDSIETMRGSLSQINCDNPAAFERAQYIQTLTTYEPDRHIRTRS